MTNDIEVGVSYRARTIGALATGAIIVLIALASISVQLASSRPASPGDSDRVSGATTRSVSPASYLFGLLGLFFLGIPLMFIAEKARIPARIGPSGVTMRDGLRFPWNEYRGFRSLTEPARHEPRPVEVGVELLFAGGIAVIKYRPITNLDEVMPIVEAIRLGDDPWV